jgi:hypothetical protein
LAVNWVSLHVDGVRTGAQIARVAEVDLDTVLRCLRVLRHHSVIAVVDAFFFTNRYEGTDRAADLLAGRSPELLRAAAEFCARHDGESDGGGGERGRTLSPPRGSAGGGSGGSASYEDRRQFQAPLSPRLHHRGSLDPSSAVPLAGLSLSPGAGPGGSGGGLGLAAGPALRHEDAAPLQAALAELYGACRATASIGDLWVEILAGPSTAPRRTGVDWRRVFRRIDHRRFASFGLIHGLIRRIHCYPMVEPGRPLDGDDEREMLTKSVLEPEASGPAGHGREPFARTASTGSHSRHHQPQQPLPPPEERVTPGRVARLMDGRRCDDELVSTIGRPLEELLEMVRDRGVTCVYAPGNHY